jgi:hypothetical protein
MVQLTYVLKARRNLGPKLAPSGFSAIVGVFAGAERVD